MRTITLVAGSIGVRAEFSGEVRPRFESRSGFRDGGEITARKVHVGSAVKRSDVLMQLEPQDLLLAALQALANLRAAETSRDLALTEMRRYRNCATRTTSARP